VTSLAIGLSLPGLEPPRWRVLRATGSEFPFDGNGATADPFFKHLIDGEAL